MPTNNSLLTDISQLDELNKEVWADSVRAREITQRVKPKFGDISSPSQNTVNEPESKATETVPLWTKRRNEVGVSETVDLLTRKMRFGKLSFSDLACQSTDPQINVVRRLGKWRNENR